jgi:hypothetical protein
MQLLSTVGKLVVLIAVLALPAWAIQDYPPAGIGGPTDLRAYVNLLNVAPGASPLDIYLNTYRIAAGVPYGQATGYRAIMQQDYSAGIRPAGSPLSDAPLVATPLRLRSQYYYTLAVLGVPGDLRLVPLADDPAIPPSGQVRVRVLNALYGAPPLTVANAQGTPLFAATPYGMVTPYRLLPLTGYGPVTVTAGNAPPLLRVLAPTEQARVYTLVIAGNPRGGVPAQAFLVVEREK